MLLIFKCKHLKLYFFFFFFYLQSLQYRTIAECTSFNFEDTVSTEVPEEILKRIFIIYWYTEKINVLFTYRNN